MPELPEVETIRKDLVRKLKGKRVVSIQVRKKNLIKGSVASFIRQVKNNRILDIDRIGKLLIIELGKDLYILVHLKMTGQLVFKMRNKIVAGGHGQPELSSDLPNKYSHIIFFFNGGSKLFFNDMRQFGYMRLVNNQQKDIIKTEYGIEPLTRNFTLDNFKKVFAGRKALVKAVLLNQKLIAGIGNIYADEICFVAQVKPTRRANKLTPAEIKRLFLASREVIKKAIKFRGTTFNDYVDVEGNKGNFVKLLKVYGRDGEKCKRCRKGIIKKIKVAGRGTHYCPQCQV